MMCFVAKMYSRMNGRPRQKHGRVCSSCSFLGLFSLCCLLYSDKNQSFSCLLVLRGQADQVVYPLDYILRFPSVAPTFECSSSIQGRGGEGAQRKWCWDPRCSPRGTPACRGTFGGRRKAVRDRLALQGGTGDFP